MKENNFILTKLGKFSLHNPIVIEGLPGVGNVGKISVDFLIDSLKAKKIIEIKSFYMPNCVFINENDEIELPKLEIYYVKIKKQDILFLTGDLQPIDEYSCYEICNNLLHFFKEINVKEIITLGGLGLEETPKDPNIFCSGTSKEIIKKYCLPNILKGTEGVFGPIIGIAGVLIGLGKEFNIPGVVLLVETSNHPSLLGIKGSQKLISVLKSKFKLNIDTKELEKEIIDIEKELKGKFLNKKLQEKPKHPKEESMNYIG
jgi:uncharacterized protein (TIGR00162 family)